MTRLILFVVSLSVASFELTANAQASSTRTEASEARVSPISMSPNTPGIDVTDKMIERWGLQAELSKRQLEAVGVKSGKLDTDRMRTILFDLDFRAKRFIDYVDINIGRSLGEPLRSDIQTSNRPINWNDLAILDDFIADAVTFGGFNTQREDEFRRALQDAASQNESIERSRARIAASRLLGEARNSAARVARGYKIFGDILRRELETRESVRNVGLVMEVRSLTTKQPTISPLTRVTMRCGGEPDLGLLFTQRKRECSELGVCRIESFAEADRIASHATVFDKLSKGGRRYLDGCLIAASMMIDGLEINPELPGKFTLHTSQSGELPP